MPVAMHLGDSGYQRWNARWGESEEFEPFSSQPMDLGSMVSGTRSIHDMVAKLILDGVLTRFPNLRLVSVENGSDWLMLLEKRLRKKANQSPQLFAEHPTDTIRAKVFTTPYAEDDIPALVERIGASQRAVRLRLAARRGPRGAARVPRAARRHRRARRRAHPARQPGAACSGEVHA